MKNIILAIPALILALLSINAYSQQADYTKMSAMLRHIVQQQSAGSRKSSAKVRPQQHLCAFIRMNKNADSILAANDCRSLAQFGNIHIADIPTSQLTALSVCPQVLRIEANRSNSILMDSTALQINALPAYAGKNLPQAYTGKGVVVGIQDIGFDLTHPNFYDSTATRYRIMRLWDQLSADTVGSDFYVGRDYASQEALQTYAHSRDGEEQRHGTHTLGIAAGSGYHSKYRGIAYESDICLVANATSEDINLIDSTDLYKYTYATDALGFKYIFDYAKSVGKPCVISFSEGDMQDFHGDDQLYYAILDSLVGPGRIIVSSAGNNSLRKRYIHKATGVNSAGAFIMNEYNHFSSVLKSGQNFEIMLKLYDATHTIADSLKLSTRDINALSDSLYKDTISVSGEDYNLSIQAYPSCYDATQTAYDINIWRKNNLSQNYISLEVADQEADVEAFTLSSYFTENTTVDPSLNAGDNTHCINTPSSAPCVICVGATSYRTGFTNYWGQYQAFYQGTNGRRADYSSMGPTFDGRIKPDVMAPGTNIISSYNSFFLERHPDVASNESDVDHFTFNGRTYPWSSNAGTSMSSPAAAGAIALWLQAKPTLTPDDIRGIFSRTCSHYDATLAYPNNEYGYGQIDVYRGLLDVLGLDGIKGISSHLPANVTISSTSTGDVCISFKEIPTKPVTVCIYSASGIQMMSTKINADNSVQIIPLNHLPHGVYAVQVNGSSASYTGSTLIRK